MKKYPGEVKQSARLQARAEEFLNKNLAAIKKTPPREVRDLFEDLQIYQTELEKRNEALCIAQRELQLARDKYSILYEFAPIGYFTINEEGLILEANCTCASLLNERKDALIGKSFQSFIAKDSLTNFHSLCEKMLRRRTKQSIELKLVKNDGREIYGHLACSVVQCANGEPTQIRMVVTDIGEQKHGELERKKVQSRCQHVSKMKALGTVAGGMANELDNILGIILGNTKTAMEGGFQKETVRKNLAEVYTAALNAKELVKQIFTFSRSPQSKLKPVRIGTVLGDVIKMIRSSGPPGIEVQHRCLYHSDSIYADPKQIRQVLLNLCSNVYHAIGEEGGVLEICVENIELDEDAVGDFFDLTPGMYFRITVSDSSPGMDHHIKDRVFIPCFSAQGMDKCPGTGLALTHGIVKSHGGDISFESEPGKGTVFRVLLPVIHDDAVREEVCVLPNQEGS